MIIQDILDRFWHCAMCQENECIPFACRVRFRHEECIDELWGVRNEVFELAIDGIYGEHRVFANIRVSVFEA